MYITIFNNNATDPAFAPAGDLCGALYGPITVSKYSTILYEKYVLGWLPFGTD